MYTAKFVTVLLLSCTILCQVAEFKAHYSQERDIYTKDKDRVNMPFRDMIGDKNGQFLVTEFNEKNIEENREDWDDNEREFSAEDFYTVLVPGKERIVASDHVYHLTKKTRGLMNFHCMNRNDRPCKINLEIYDTNHNILFRTQEKQSSALKIEFRAMGDIFFRFINQYKKPARVFFAFECIKCGKWNKKFITKKDIKRKLEKVKSYNKLIAKLMILTHKSKQVVFSFKDSKF